MTVLIDGYEYNVEPDASLEDVALKGARDVDRQREALLTDHDYPESHAHAGALDNVADDTYALACELFGLDRSTWRVHLASMWRREYGSDKSLAEKLGM